ncbi:MAG: glycosyltransferase [Candidatus Baltobacteraceae bacterium]
MGHVCAATALYYAARTAAFAPGSEDLPQFESDPGKLPSLSVVVPARDEERSVEACLRSLLAQRFLDMEVIVVDDRSSDATPEILRQLAAEFPQLRVVNGEKLPAGWVGKPWALHQGYGAAQGEWLLFTDADSVHASTGAATALWFATTLGVDALSIATGQELGSFWERALLPSILGMILFAAGTPAELNDPLRPERALANGQYLLVSRVAYDALGGHSALRGEVVEDIEFARRLKVDGRFELAFVIATRLARVRMYRSFVEVWDGFTKNFYLGARGHLPSLALAVAFFLAISVAPPVLALRALRRRRYAALAEALATSACIVATASWSFQRVGIPRRLALFQPLGITVLAAIAGASTWHALAGHGVRWRGRTYPPRSRWSDGTAREPGE